MGKECVLIVVPFFRTKESETGYKQRIRSKFDLTEKNLCIKFFNTEKPLTDLKNLLKKKNVETVIFTDDLREEQVTPIKHFLVLNHGIKKCFLSIDEFRNRAKSA